MNKTILAIDDSPSVRQMVQMTLRGAGYTVVELWDTEVWSDPAAVIDKVRAGIRACRTAA